MLFTRESMDHSMPNLLIIGTRLYICQESCKCLLYLLDFLHAALSSTGEISLKVTSSKLCLHLHSGTAPLINSE